MPSAKKGTRKKPDFVLENTSETLVYLEQAAKIGSYRIDLLAGQWVGSEGFAKLFGFSSTGPFPLNEFENIVHPEDLPRARENFSQSIRADKEYKDFYRIIHKLSGAVLWVESHSKIERDEHGTALGISGFMRDISTLKQQEMDLLIGQKKLEESQKEIELQKELLHSIIETIPSALFVKDIKDNFKIILWNSAAEKIFQIEREEIIGKCPHEIWSKHQADYAIAADQKVVASATLAEQEEETYRAKDGHPVYLRTIKLPLYVGAEKSASYLLTISEDITEQEKKNDELKIQKMTNLNTARLASLGEMAGGIAHEINNPLCIIQGKADQIRQRVETDAPDKEKICTDLTTIDNTLLRITKIIKGLQSFSRDSKSDPFEETKIMQIITDTMELCQAKFKASKISVEIHCDEKLSAQCRSTEISQVLMNLLSNSFDVIEKFSEPWIKVDVNKFDNFIRISVTDSGKGIPASVAQKMMEPFYTTKGIGKGTGLGLSISKGIIGAHQGRFYYDPSSKNTRFVIEIPVTHAARHAKAA